MRQLRINRLIWTFTVVERLNVKEAALASMVETARVEKSKAAFSTTWDCTFF
jgi:hypothetical protein